ncbi:MAG TPA: hypothetical protein VMW56_23535 [Candidatus Margulisiibacteriota bacterium]|nr:hypothetical protein [Candidatus Margulisiibacteriota bacterium]
MALVFTTTYAAFATANYVGQLTQEGPHVRGREHSPATTRMSSTAFS